MDFKRCTVCRSLKPILHFSTNGRRFKKNGEQELSPRCKQCNREKTRAYKEKNSEMVATYQKTRNDHLKKTFHNIEESRAALLRKRFSTARSKARIKGVEFTISLDEYIGVVGGGLSKCHYCNGDLPRIGHCMDRVDNNLGYAKRNVVPCCSRCNSMKGPYLTYAEMKSIWEGRVAEALLSA